MIAELLKTVYQEQETVWRQKHQHAEQSLHLLRQIERVGGTAFRELVQTCCLPKGTYLLRQGDTARHIWILLSGVAREYLIEVKGCTSYERVSHFFRPGHFVCNHNSAFTQSPAKINIQLVTQSELLKLDWKSIHQLEEQVPQISPMEKLLLSDSGEERKEHTHCVTNLTATEHYYYLLKNQSKLMLQLPISDIASYIGITPASLSRINCLVQSASKVSTITHPANYRRLFLPGIGRAGRILFA